ncbi:Potassium voltage-gated channel [Phytophthora citrophthora]|uniref:Potassium voltage-gated channel n=1 Tax=Phytophthora citrophthora TaxID=4793 RepID=A0AAD9LQA0_9STRA|nr:Potassium voltage-gated channel [Phytophthora citrophthora]
MLPNIGTMQPPPASPSYSLVQRPPVAKQPNTVAVLKRQSSSSRNVNKMGEKAANHDAMMKKFNLRKMSSNLHFPTKFGRASEVLIDKAIGSKVQKNRRFSLHRSIRTMTNAKTRRNVLRTLTSPITPQSWASTCHGILLLLVYHFQLIYLPFLSSYYPHGSFATAITAIVLEFVFLLDVLLNFNTSYVEQGVLITSRRKIARNYIQTWLIFDLFSAFPIQLTYYFVTGHFSHYVVRGVQIMLIVLRLLRVAVLERGVLVNRVASRFTEWVRYSRYSHLLGIANLMGLVLLIAHYMACFWHVVSRKDDDYSRIMEMYVADYYYAVSLIQGQGNAGGTMNENLFSSVAIIGGSVILAIVFGNVAMLVSNFNANTTNYHRKMEAVYETMEKMDLPLRLRERVNEYYKHVWLEYESLDGNINKFQKELTHTLGIEVGLYKHMDLVVKVPFWKDCTPDFLTQIVLNLGVRVYMPDDYVVRRREIGNDMMMINRGYCKLTKPITAKAEDESMMQSFHPTDPMDEPSDYEGDSSEDFSSEDERLEDFGSGMFGASIDSRRWSQPDVWNPISDFTDIRRFQSGHGKRPSYPEGAERKPKRFREYIRPGQAFGEMSLLMNYKRTANVRAITFVEMCVLSRKDFQNIISRHPEDRRRVLISMLESCIENEVVPIRSKILDPDANHEALPANREPKVTSPRPEAVSVVRAEGSTPRVDDRYPVNLSGRSRAAKNESLADILWKRSNTSGDMLRHTEEERGAARLRRQMRSRRSLPSEIVLPTKPDEGPPPLK